MIELAYYNKYALVGLLLTIVDRENDYISRLTVTRFIEKSYLIFSRDVYLFFKELLINSGFRKIVFSAIIDNPTINIYKRMITKFNLCKIVGTFKNNRKMRDEIFYDDFYEIYQNNFLAYRNKAYTQNK
jgi:hypothetical protein